MKLVDSPRRRTPPNPWSLLGADVDSDLLGIDQALSISRSNDVVSPVTLYYDDDGGFRDVENFVGIYSDIYGLLNVSSPNYEITQRKEILEFAYEITGLSKGDAKIEAVGNIKSGKVFFAYLSTPDIVIDPKGVAEIIDTGLYCATSFDGTLPNMFGYSLVRPYCTNVLNFAFKNLDQAIKVRHTKFSDERIREAALALEYIGAIEQEVVDTAERMLAVEGDEPLEKILNHFYPIDEDLSDKGKTHRLDKRGEVRSLYDGVMNNSVDKAGRNGYSAYQAFTEYLDHGRMVYGDSPESTRAAASVLPSKVQNDKLKACEIILN